jgi:bifunctional enzyme CysN/CysC
MRDPFDIDGYLAAHERKSLLRFITCGSVDDGKSTLIGRLLHDSSLILDDHLAALEMDSKTFGTQGDDLDLALLVDGLVAEREQGITIDVAYRFFTTDRRKFIVADSPGHEQYTRNMVTAASNAEAAVVLIDARKGVITQTRRHSHLISMLGIRSVAFAVNKLDLLAYDRDVFVRVSADAQALASRLGLDNATVIPMSALRGDNVTTSSLAMPWYEGPSLLHWLETVNPLSAATTGFRFPVQWVNRPSSDFRGFSGRVASGVVAPGDEIVALPSGRRSTVERIVTFDGDLAVGSTGESVTLTLTDEIDISRGDVLCRVDDIAEVSDQFEVQLVWMHDTALVPGRPYLMKIGTRTVRASVSTPKYSINVNTFEHVAAKSLGLNELGVATLTTDQLIAFDPYVANHQTGGFILIDRVSNDTIAAGMIQFALRRSHNLHGQALDVGRQTREQRNGHRSIVVWFTGLSASGKSTIANLVEQRLAATNMHTYLLDGDNVRLGLNRDLGFTEADRVENIRRVTEVARLMTDAGLITLVSFISPYRAERDAARERIGADEFIEVYVDTPLAEAERRDPKGLYAKARRGELKNFTGIDAPYEPPDVPEIHIQTLSTSADQAADLILDLIKTRTWLTD